MPAAAREDDVLKKGMNLASVGMALDVEHGKLIVVGLVPGSAADRGEVIVGDEVVGVDGNLVHTLSLGRFLCRAAPDPAFMLACPVAGLFNHVCIQ